MILNISRIFHNETKQDGTKYKDKNGNSYIRVVIKTPDLPGDVSFLDYNGTAQAWEDGTKLDLDKLGMIVEEGEWQGKKQFTLKRPSKPNPQTAALEERLKTLEEKVEKIREFLKSKFQ